MRLAHNNNSDDYEGFGMMSRVRSKASAPSSVSVADSCMNRGQNSAVFSLNNPASFKSSSAMPSRGYDNKLSLRVTVFASLMMVCVRRYIQDTGETGHIIDEITVMVIKTYTRIGDLYHKVKCAELPVV
ncbi:hypothetical protein F4779DRAFT_599486 [Xylariaceae sp. FL0662B]|nr:hypothetical protein F4779DRAFT_599486 [Xylariaceae sp. FL0662B]